MPFKIDPTTGAIVTQDVNGQKLPVFVHADGKEVPFDGDSTISTISRLNGEAKSHRERAETAETALKTFEGIADPAAARKALETVKNLDDKKLVDAGEVEKVKAEAIKAIEEKYAPTVKKVTALEQQLYGEKIGGAFARSKVIAEKFAIPADLVQARFGSAFKIEGDKVVAYDASGNRIFSRARPGEVADFEEALETLVDQYPYRDQILKGSGASGSGAGGNGNQGAGGKKTLTRDQFSKLDPTAQSAAARDANTVITD